jgi:hypothetical protein
MIMKVYGNRKGIHLNDVIQVGACANNVNGLRGGGNTDAEK